MTLEGKSLDDPVTDAELILEGLVILKRNMAGKKASCSIKVRDESDHMAKQALCLAEKYYATLEARLKTMLDELSVEGALVYVSIDDVVKQLKSDEKELSDPS